LTSLSWEAKISIVDMSENLIAIDGGANGSKGTYSWETWTRAKDYYPDLIVRSKMIAREQAVRLRIQNEISARVKAR
jgi:hypothetical protein